MLTIIKLDRFVKMIERREMEDNESDSLIPSAMGLSPQSPDCFIEKYLFYHIYPIPI